MCNNFNSHLFQYGIAVNYVGVATSAMRTEDGYLNVQLYPFYITQSGEFSNSGFGFQNFGERFWMNTSQVENGGYYYADDSNGVFPALYHNRQYGIK